MSSMILLNTNPINSIEIAKATINTSIKHNEGQSLLCVDAIFSVGKLALSGRNDNTESASASIVPVIANR